MEVPSAKNRRLIVVGMLSLAAIFIAIAVIITAGNPDVDDLPVAIQSVDPEPDTNVLSQTKVSVDLAVGYTAELEINGVPIPEEELFRVEALNQLTFQPGIDKIVERLLPDQNCVRVRYWLIASGDADAAFYTWCFFAS